VAALDQFGHLAVEEGQQQGADVGAVDVGVGHDDDAVVAQLFGVVFVLADAGAQRGDQRDDFLLEHELVEAGLLDVEDLALQRQDGLELAVAALLGGAAGGVTLDQVELAQGRVLSWQSASLPGRPNAVEHALAARHSRALRAASRARAASTILPQMVLASAGRSCRKSAASARRLLRPPDGLREDTSFILVCEANLGRAS
jgi:hypothetical protein